MNSQFFKPALLLMIAAEAVSLMAFIFPVLSLPLLVLALAAAFIVSWKNLEWGIYLLFGELFFGSRGHLLEYDLGLGSLSLRVVIFAAVFLAWLLGSVKNRELRVQTVNFKFQVLYVLLLIAVGWGMVSGYLNQNSLGNIFNDANGYLYLLIFPAVLAVLKTREHIERLLEILAAAIIVIALKTLALFLWFAFG